MGWGRKRHPLEAIIVALSIALFAGGIGVASWVLLEQGAVTVGTALVGLVGGWLFVERVGRPSQLEPAFVPVEFEADDRTIPAGPDEINADVLLLDDPLPPPPEESRVVRLFARDPVNASPGEMVERIGAYLDDKRIAQTLAGPPLQPAPDASAELYAALANIRASLK